MKIRFAQPRIGLLGAQDGIFVSTGNVALGSYIAMSGDGLTVAAATGVGAQIFIYRRSSGVWALEATISGKGPLYLSANGSTLLCSNTTSATIFERVGSAWSVVYTTSYYSIPAGISADGQKAYAYYANNYLLYTLWKSPTWTSVTGVSVGLSAPVQSVQVSRDGLVCALAYPDDNTYGFGAGRVLVGRRTLDTGNLSSSTTLPAIPAVMGGRWGQSLAVSPDGNRVLIGAHSNNSGSPRGAVYIYTNNSWSLESALSAATANDSATPLAISADNKTVIAGAAVYLRLGAWKNYVDSLKYTAENNYNSYTPLACAISDNGLSAVLGCADQAGGVSTVKMLRAA